MVCRALLSVSGTCLHMVWCLLLLLPPPLLLLLLHPLL
jgi:hypothetical protein